MRSRNKRQALNPNKNDNGLAPPGKRIIKKRSDGVLNGHVPGDASSPLAVTTAVSPSASLAASPDDQQQPVLYHHAANGSPNPNIADLMRRDDSRDSAGLATGLSVEGSANGQLGHGSSDSTNVKGNGNATAAVKTGDTPHASGFKEMQRCVIGSHTLGDVIAMLLLLQQLPTPLLTIAQLCYVYMTIWDPSNGWSFTMPDFTTSRGENPSLIVTGLADLCVILIWFLLPIGSDFVLDLAQVVIAISLGGGYAVKGGLTTASICTTIVAVCHLLRQQTWRQFAMDMASAILSNAHLGALGIPFGLPIFSSAIYSPHNRARVLLELHIVSQGIVRSIRRLYDQTADTKPPSTSSKRSRDIDLPSAQSNATSSATQDSNAGSSRNMSTDGRSPGPPPILREHQKEKAGASGKKRRKQGTFVRNQQPLWAVIANAKILVSKEIESSQAARDSFEAGATSVESVGSAIKHCLDDRVWISKLTDTEVWFSLLMENSTSGDGPPDSDTETRNLDQSITNAACKTSRRTHDEDNNDFQVYVNEAVWISTMDLEDDIIQDGEGKERQMKKGRIVGLLPSTKHVVEFRKDSGRTRICSVSILTRPMPLHEQGLASPSSVKTTTPSRALSPITALKSSIAIADTKLNEQRARSRKNRKDHKTSLASLRQEVKILEGRIASIGGNDERQKSRQTSFRKQILQAGDSFEDISRQIESLGDIPQEQQEAYDEGLEKWEVEKDSRDNARAALDSSKSEADRQITAAKSETASIKQKKEKIEARLKKLENQRDSLAASNTQSRMTKEQREIARTGMLSIWHAKERHLLDGIQYWDQSRRSVENSTAHIEPQHNYFSDSSYVQQTAAGRMMASQTPDSSQSGLAGGGWPSSISGFKSIPVSVGGQPAPPAMTQFGPFNNFNARAVGEATTNGTPPIRSRRGSFNQANSARGRSSSMLSQVSGLTDHEVPLEQQQPQQPQQPQAAYQHQLSQHHQQQLYQPQQPHHSPPFNEVGLNDSGSTNSPVPSSLVMHKLGPIGFEVGRGSPSRQ